MNRKWTLFTTKKVHIVFTVDIWRQPLFIIERLSVIYLIGTTYIFKNLFMRLIQIYSFLINS